MSQSLLIVSQLLAHARRCLLLTALSMMLRCMMHQRCSKHCVSLSVMCWTWSIF